MSTTRGGGTKSSSPTPDEGKVGPVSADAPATQREKLTDEHPTENTTPSSTTLRPVSSPHIGGDDQQTIAKWKTKVGDMRSSEPPPEGQRTPSRPLHEEEQEDTQLTRITPATSGDSSDRPRQVIAVSASKGPAAFFNLARKFLVTDEMCDLSALEGAIVSAVDAAHLLERSKLATIVRVHTSYVSVEPKRKKQHHASPDMSSPSEQLFVSASPSYGTAPSYAATVAGIAASTPGSRSTGQTPVSIQTPVSVDADPQGQQKGGKASGGRELRRARIVITVKRTEGYKQWLEENPLQAIIAGDGDDDLEAPPPDIDLSSSMP